MKGFRLLLTFVNLFSFFPAFLFLHCIFIFFFKKWLGPVGVFYSSITALVACLLVALNALFFVVSNGGYFYIDLGRWFFCLDLIDSHLIFCVDTLALASAALVLSLTALALYFGVEYMYRDAFVSRLLYLLNLFATSVVFLFFCYDYFLIMFAWECVGLFSLLLVNFYSMRIYTVKAALKTFVFSRISDMFMFFSFVLVVAFFNTTDLSLIFLQIPFLTFHYLFLGHLAVHFLSLFAFALATSGVVKAAQFFFHVWLPDAMEAPTPASALIHSSTLVVAGVFLILRFSALFEFTLLVNYYLAVLGAVTLAFGAVVAAFQTDIKKLVAYSTISQIGYLVCGCGFCCYEEVLLYLIMHALNKAFLFVLVGYVVHFFSGNTDMRQMGGLYLYSFDVAVLLLGVCFNLAGLPYSAGFFGKEFLLFQILKDDYLSYLVRACWLVSFLFTPIYMFILIFVVLFGPKKGPLAAYSGFWKFSFFTNVRLLTNASRLDFSPTVWLGTRALHRFQFTAVTCRPTVYVLFGFWLFFFFSGESLLLLLLDFSSTTETVIGPSFFSCKSHSAFRPLTGVQILAELIMFYITFFTLAGFLFLVNLRYSFNYKYLNNLWISDLMLVYALVGTYSPLLGLFGALIALARFVFWNK